MWQLFKKSVEPTPQLLKNQVETLEETLKIMENTNKQQVKSLKALVDHYKNLYEELISELDGVEEDESTPSSESNGV